MLEPHVLTPIYKRVRMYFQVADCQTYVKTIHHLHLHTPSIILIPDTFLTSKGRNNAPNTILVECLQEEFQGVPIEPVARKYWNEAAGGVFYYTSLGVFTLRRASPRAKFYQPTLR
jgi:hypothetical protein